MQKGVEWHMMTGAQTDKRSDHPIDNEPCREKIEALKSVEADQPVFFEPARRKHNDRRNPAYRGNITEDGSRPR